MARFSLYIPKLTAFEGGYVDDPDDLGGATNMGITYRTYCAYMVKKGLRPTPEKFRAMTIEQRDAIIESEYWDKCKGDEILNQSVAEALIDWFINSGYNATIALQKILKMEKIDGIVGPKTLRAINTSNPKELFNALITARLEFVEGIVKRDPTQQKFLKGWKNRIKSLEFKY